MTSDGDSLRTEQVLSRSQQYDAALLYHANLGGLKLRSIGAALQPCASLTVLNLCRNRLTSLAGLQCVGATLQYLDAGENELVDISALQACGTLRRLSLQGNQLRSWEALQPLSGIPTLRELTLRAEIRLDDDPEPLVLDNPLCGQNLDEYREKCVACVLNLHWLDGRLVDSDTPCSSSKADAKAAVVEQAAACTDQLRRATADAVAETSSNERTLEKLLSAAKTL